METCHFGWPESLTDSYKIDQNKAKATDGEKKFRIVKRSLHIVPQI